MIQYTAYLYLVCLRPFTYSRAVSSTIRGVGGGLTADDAVGVNSDMITVVLR
jgi:hypothetical protein